MNTLPSMDRHIQQTNDRLQCIKQVQVPQTSDLRPVPVLKDFSQLHLHFLSFLPLTPLSSHLIWASVFFWPLAPLTQIMLHWVRQPDGQREVNLAANWRKKKKTTSKSLTCPTLLYIVFLIHNVRRLLLWFFFFS